MKLGVNRENQITELEEAGLRRLPLVAGAGHDELAADSAAGIPGVFSPGQQHGRPQ